MTPDVAGLGVAALKAGSGGSLSETFRAVVHEAPSVDLIRRTILFLFSREHQELAKLLLDQLEPRELMILLALLAIEFHAGRQDAFAQLRKMREAQP